MRLRDDDDVEKLGNDRILFNPLEFEFIVLSPIELEPEPEPLLKP